MAAGYQELFIEQGSDYNTSIILDDVNGQPMNLTDYTGKSQIRKSYYSSNATAEFTVTINDPTSGTIALDLNANTTSNIAAGRYVYDVFIKSDTNVKTKVLEGIVNVLPQVTVF